MTGFHAHQATAAGITAATEDQATRRRSPRRRFWLHFGEMLLYEHYSIDYRRHPDHA